MAYPPQGFLFQPPVSVALPSPCPSFGSGLLLGPRTEDLGRSSGSAFAPYSGSTCSGFSAHLCGGEPRAAAAAAAAALGSFAGAGYDPSSGISGSVDYHPFGPLGPYPFGDPTYRKNATRDATATLKAWLSEHRKNPYPTKGEKIMLAIITKMTLTQVSTWFANARRRLKKENKMTWTPRTRSEDEEDDLDLERSQDEEEPLKMDEGPERRSRSAPRPSPPPDSCVLVFRDDSGSDSERGGADPDPGARTLPCIPDPSPTGAPPKASRLEPPGPPTKDSIQGPTAAPKPKLWSLAEIATSADKSRSSREGEGPWQGPAHPASTSRTLVPHGPALPRHLYYASPFAHRYSGYGPLGPLPGIATATHVNGLHQTMLQRAEAKLHSHELQKGS